MSFDSRRCLERPLTFKHPKGFSCKMTVLKTLDTTRTRKVSLLHELEDVFWLQTMTWKTLDIASIRKVSLVKWLFFKDFEHYKDLKSFKKFFFYMNWRMSFDFRWCLGRFLTLQALEAFERPLLWNDCFKNFGHYRDLKSFSSVWIGGCLFTSADVLKDLDIASIQKVSLIKWLFFFKLWTLQGSKKFKKFKKFFFCMNWRMS